MTRTRQYSLAIVFMIDPADGMVNYIGIAAELRSYTKSKGKGQSTQDVAEALIKLKNSHRVLLKICSDSPMIVR